MSALEWLRVAVVVLAGVAFICAGGALLTCFQILRLLHEMRESRER